jgi:uncharacterized membrane protein required for colicin V production
MNWLVALYLAVLFYALSPNVLVRLPPNGNKTTVAATHAVIFGVIVYFTTKMVWRLSMSMGIHEGMATKGGKPAPPKKK